MGSRANRVRALVTGLVLAAVSLLAGCFLPPNEPPVAAFSATPPEGPAPLSVAFDASESRDPDGIVRSYTWSFGDGTSGTGEFVMHVYASPGNYTARLTVEDRRHATDTTTKEIVARSGTNYAILVGIANYPAPMPQLDYTDDDAAAMRDRLLSLPGWDASHVVLLLDEQATVADFRAALDALSGRGADDQLLVFFSGHGDYYRDGNGDEADGRDEALLFYDTPILDDTLALLLEQVPMQRIAVIVDACYGGGVLDSRGLPRRVLDDGDFLDDLARLGVRDPKDLDRLSKEVVGIAACRYDQVSWELASLRHGILTYALLEALDGRADAAGDRDAETSAEECFDYVYMRMQILGATSGAVEVPQLLDHCPGELELAGVP
jgi:hypothetical protein